MFDSLMMMLGPCSNLADGLCCCILWSVGMFLERRLTAESCHDEIQKEEEVV